MHAAGRWARGRLVVQSPLPRYNYRTLRVYASAAERRDGGAVDTRARGGPRDAAWHDGRPPRRPSSARAFSHGRSCRMRLPSFVGAGLLAFGLVVLTWWAFVAQRQAFELALLTQERHLDQKLRQIEQLETQAARIVQRPTGVSEASPVPPVAASVHEGAAAASPTGTVVTELATCTSDMFLSNMQLLGHEYHQQVAASPTACCIACSADPKCAGATYHVKEGACHYVALPPSQGYLRAQPCDKVGCSAFAQPGVTVKDKGGLKVAPTCQGTNADVEFATKLFREALGTRSTSVDGQTTHDPATADIVVVTAWRRPAFLAHTLVRLLSATAAEEHSYVFVLEPGYEPLIETIIAAFPLDKRVFRAPAHFFGGRKCDEGAEGVSHEERIACINTRRGNSFTTLEGYRYVEQLVNEHRHRDDEAQQGKGRRVYLVEEDVFVAKDFFRFNRAAELMIANQGPNFPFCAHGAPCDGASTDAAALKLGTAQAEPAAIWATISWNLNAVPALAAACRQAQERIAAAAAGDGSPTGAAASQQLQEDQRLVSAVFTWPTFQSIALSVKATELDVATRHAVSGYYNGPLDYIARSFPAMQRSDGSSVAPIHTPEQDGVILRTLVSEKRRSVFPVCPRAFHGGFVGYNHPHDDQGGSNPAPDDPLSVSDTSESAKHAAADWRGEKAGRCASLQQRSERLHARLQQIEEAASISGDRRDGDVMVAHLEDYEWTELQLIPNCDFWRGPGNAGCPDPFTQDGRTMAG